MIDQTPRDVLGLEICTGLDGARRSICDDRDFLTDTDAVDTRSSPRRRSTTPTSHRPLLGAGRRRDACCTACGVNDDRVVHDPNEGVAADGTISTGVDRARVHAAFEPVIAAAVDAIRVVGEQAALYLYGSVATGQAMVGTSDVDLLTVDVATADAETIERLLSPPFAALCRGVEIAATQSADLEGDADEPYGNRVFLRHYCVHLAGPRHHRPAEPFAADRRAARGFNGDIAQHARRWRDAIDRGDDPTAVARRLARKTLLAVAGLVSVHDGTWTTDRSTAARRWALIDRALSEGLETLVSWTDRASRLHSDHVIRALDNTVDPLANAFADAIGLWP
jgi:uncharacterized protein